MKLKGIPICIRLMRWLFPVGEKQRMDYRKCLHHIEAQTDDLIREVKKMSDKSKYPR